MDFNLLIIKNRLDTVISDDIEKLKLYIQQRTPLTLNVQEIVSDIKDMESLYFIDGKDGSKYYGIKDIKDTIRHLNLVPDYLYHACVFIYDGKDVHAPIDGSLANWTYFNPLLPDTDFIEVITSKTADAIDDVFRVLSHEIIHVFHRRAHRAGIVTDDTMDVYDQEFVPLSPTGNRARNLKQFINCWSQIAEQKRTIGFIAMLKDIITTLQKQFFNTMPNKNILMWAEAAKEHEGWFIGSRSQRNNSPSNARYVGQRTAIGADKDNFAIFSTYDAGWNYLITILTNACTGKSKVYSPEMTLLEYYAKYAPATDNNDPKAYAEFVASKLGVPPETKLKELV